jgi:ribosome biogenesis GTPase
MPARAINTVRRLYDWQPRCPRYNGFMGRKSHGKSSHREQAPKQARGFSRGHGSHHRQRSGQQAPSKLGTGRGRTDDYIRTRDFSRLDDDALADLERIEKRANVEKRVQESGESETFGAKLSGTLTRGVVVEVRKGNFLTRVLIGPEPGGGETRFKTGDILRTIVRGVLQQFDLGLSSLVAPGDEVDMVVPPQSGSKELFQADLYAVLVRVLPRRNEFRRVHPSGRSVQTLAANVDRVVVVASAGEPEFRPGFVDRVLVCAGASSIPAALIVNKIDLGLPEDDEELLRVYEGLGIPVFRLSVLKPETTPDGFERLKQLLSGSRSLLTGHSGVGKSSLMRALDPALDEAVVRTGDISRQTGKGTHTTTHARLFQLDLGGGTAGDVIDTPGVREFTPADTDRRNLWGWFPEIAKLQGQCAFNGCTHTVEQGCAVLAAVERGEIHPRRQQSYLRIYETLPN